MLTETPNPAPTFLRKSGVSELVEPLLDPRAGDDRIAVAEAHTGAEGTMFVPEAIELRVDRVDLGLDLGIVLVGEPVPELGALFTQPRQRK